MPEWGYPAELEAASVRNQTDILRYQAHFLYTLAAIMTLLLAAMAWRSAPGWEPVATAVLVVSIVTALVRPVLGLYLTVALTMIGDAVVWPWWPFTKNLSSRESILFLNDSIFISPLELVIAATVFSFFLRRLGDPTWRFKGGPLLWPITVFTGFIVVGLIRGLGSGGDRRVAVFESRALFYGLAIYVLVINVFTRRREIERVLMVAMVAIWVQSVFSLRYYLDLPAEEQTVLERLGEHSSAVHMAVLVVFLLATFMLDGRQGTRFWLIMMLPVVVIAFMLSQRRAAMVALFAGVAVVAFFAFHRRRRAFWVFVPTFLILGSGFVAATWGAPGALGLPAQAVQSVIAPDSLSAADQGSNLYREIEAINVHATIRGNPLFGVGFGRTFDIVYAMPDISFYEFWAYKPHHSVLWIWIKMGFFGFVAMLFMFARTLQVGTRSALSVGTRRESAYVVTAIAIVIMLLVYSYVDIGWDPRSMVLLGLAMGICAQYESAAGGSGVIAPRRRERAPRARHEVVA